MEDALTIPFGELMTPVGQAAALAAQEAAKPKARARQHANNLFEPSLVYCESHSVNHQRVFRKLMPAGIWEICLYTTPTIFATYNQWNSKQLSLPTSHPLC